jgi:hypothetical protein
MREKLDDLSYCLGKAAEYRKKAEQAEDPRLKAALESVYREYMARARELDPEHCCQGN